MVVNEGEHRKMSGSQIEGCSSTLVNLHILSLKVLMVSNIKMGNLPNAAEEYHHVSSDSLPMLYTRHQILV